MMWIYKHLQIFSCLCIFAVLQNNNVALILKISKIKKKILPKLNFSYNAKFKSLRVNFKRIFIILMRLYFSFSYNETFTFFSVFVHVCDNTTYTNRFVMYCQKRFFQ